MKRSRRGLDDDDGDDDDDENQKSTDKANEKNWWVDDASVKSFLVKTCSKRLQTKRIIVVCIHLRTNLKRVSTILKKS